MQKVPSQPIDHKDLTGMFDTPLGLVGSVAAGTIEDDLFHRPNRRVQVCDAHS